MIAVVGSIYVNLQAMEQDQVLEYRNTAMKLSDLTMNFYLKGQYENIEDMMKVQTQTSAIQYMAFNMGGQPRYTAGNGSNLKMTEKILRQTGAAEIKIIRKQRYVYLNIPFVEAEDVIQKQSSLLVVFSLEEFQKNKKSILWSIVGIVSLVTGSVVLFYLLAKTSHQLQERNRELAETSRKLKVEEQTKTGMIKAIAHDALHYVTVIQMINDNLKAQAKNTKQAMDILPFVNDIIESNGSLTKLLEDLKYNEYLSRGLVIENPVKIQFVEFLSTILTSLKEMFSKKNIQCEFFHENPTAYVFVDRELIKRVVFNLLHNAFKYTRRDSKIKVWCRQEADKIVTFIQDAGAGIPEKQWEIIFDPSVRLADSDFVRPEDKRGTGLGLTNSRKSVELYQGKLGVYKSAKNIGTTFYFSLPLVPAENAGSTGDDL